MEILYQYQEYSIITITKNQISSIFMGKNHIICGKINNNITVGNYTNDIIMYINTNDLYEFLKNKNCRTVKIQLDDKDNYLINGVIFNNYKSLCREINYEALDEIEFTHQTNTINLQKLRSILKDYKEDAVFFVSNDLNTYICQDNELMQYYPLKYKSGNICISKHLLEIFINTIYKFKSNGVNRIKINVRSNTPVKLRYSNNVIDIEIYMAPRVEFDDEEVDYDDNCIFDKLINNIPNETRNKLSNY